MCFAWRGLIGLGGNVGNIIAAFPIAEIFLDHREHFIALQIADYDYRRVLGPVVTPIELQTVIVLIGKVLDVFNKTHGGVRIRMDFVRGRAQDFVSFLFRIGAVLIELAQHGFGLGLESVRRILQTLKSIGLELENFVQVIFGKDFVIDGAVVGGVGVRIGSGLLQNRIAFLS